MKFYIINTQYLEDYGTRFKFKGGHTFRVLSADIGNALATVWTHLREQAKRHESMGAIPNVEYPITPENLEGFSSKQESEEGVEEWERKLIIDLCCIKPVMTFKVRI